ncbi:hypothetical protein QFC19_003655 [Naganishia cerealis]|uniref:Uncharacterized protein n=1 Tax=Naganishia cerealis TaxID=610337 RepID=A0ACC2VZW6_9TREE|nr:hypothetical protein QFC19_003655 [Naganishia cerealis]
MVSHYLDAPSIIEPNHMSVIAIAGGSGQLGRAIVEAIVNDGKYKVVVLGREVDEEKQKAILEEHKVHTVISTINAMGQVEPELNLIKAANTSSVTKRYIPSMWGVPHTAEIATCFPIAIRKMAVLQALDATSLEYTAVYNGYFLEYFVAPKIKTYMNPMAIVLDIPNSFAAIPGSGDVLVTFTHTFDIAKYVTALQLLPKWDKKSIIVGDKVTWNEFVKIAEQAKSEKFTVVHDSLETLKSGHITELPSHPLLYLFFHKELLQSLFAAFGLMFERGVFNLDVKGSLVEQFPDIRPRKVKELVDEAYSNP